MPTQQSDGKNVAPNLLTNAEKEICRKIEKSDAGLASQRAVALLSIEAGLSQRAAAEKSGLTIGQVRYLKSAFNKKRLGIFPNELINDDVAEQTEEKPQVMAAADSEVTEILPENEEATDAKAVSTVEALEVSDKPAKKAKSKKIKKKKSKKTKKKKAEKKPKKDKKKKEKSAKQVEKKAKKSKAKKKGKKKEKSGKKKKNSKKKSKK